MPQDLRRNHRDESMPNRLHCLRRFQQRTCNVSARVGVSEHLGKCWYSRVADCCTLGIEREIRRILYISSTNAADQNKKGKEGGTKEGSHRAQKGKERKLTCCPGRCKKTQMALVLEEGILALLNAATSHRLLRRIESGCIR
jgi:hypothetical protein